MIFSAHGDMQSYTEADCCESCGRPLVSSYPAGVQLDATGFTAPCGTRVPLTYRQFQVMELLLRHFGQTVHRERIYSHVWGGSERDPQSVDVYTSHINKKLRPVGFEIRAVWGIGKALDLLRAPSVKSVNKKSRQTIQEPEHAV